VFLKEDLFLQAEKA